MQRCYAIIAALAGFLLPWQTIWVIRSGMLGGVPWSLATIGVYASDFVLIVVAIVGFVYRWRTDRQWFATVIAILTAIAAANVWVSADPRLSAVGWVRIIVLLLAIAGIPQWSLSSRRAFLGGFLVAMGAHAVLGIVQFFTFQSFASTLLGIAPHTAWTLGDSVIVRDGERWLRAYGGFPHPNVLGLALLVAMTSFLVISAPEAHPPLAETVQRAKRSDGHRTDRTGISRLHFVPLEMTMWGIFVVALILSFSRSALLGFGVLLIVCAYRRATRHLALLGAVVVAIGIALTWSFWVPRVTITNANETRSVSERTIAFDRGITFLRIPKTALLGTGLHAMPQAIIASDPAANPYTTAQPVHSTPLLALTEIGLDGVIILLIVFWQLARSVFVIRHSSFVILMLPLLPSLLFDHHLWSLPIGPALLFAVVLSVSLDKHPAVA